MTPQEVQNFLSRWPGAYEHLLDGLDYDLKTLLRGTKFFISKWGVPVYDDGSVEVVWDPDAQAWVDPDQYAYDRRPKESKMKIVKKGQLQSLFTEGSIARLLKEEDDSLAHESGVSGGSLDAQVDRYLSQYEASAKKDEVEPASVGQMESLDWRDLVKGRLINEAGPEDEDPATDDQPTNSEPSEDEVEKLGIDKLDVEAFANDVVRLIENYDNLLEVRNTLVRRAKSFLEKVYDDEVVDAFESTLRDDHGIEAGKDKLSIAADKFVAPAADRANGSAEPGTAGGGVG